jgi:hypothetical protein
MGGWITSGQDGAVVGAQDLGAIHAGKYQCLMTVVPFNAMPLAMTILLGLI